jgi:hypothetical protein
VPTAVLTREEIVAEMERVSWRRRRLHADQVVDRFRHGRLEAAGELADVIALAFILHSSDPLHIEL